MSPPPLLPLHQRSVQHVTSQLSTSCYPLLLSWQSCWACSSLVFGILCWVPVMMHTSERCHFDASPSSICSLRLHRVSYSAAAVSCWRNCSFKCKSLAITHSFWLVFMNSVSPVWRGEEADTVAKVTASIWHDKVRHFTVRISMFWDLPLCSDHWYEVWRWQGATDGGGGEEWVSNKKLHNLLFFGLKVFSRCLSWSESMVQGDARSRDL